MGKLSNRMSNLTKVITENTDTNTEFKTDARDLLKGQIEYVSRRLNEWEEITHSHKARAVIEVTHETDTQMESNQEVTNVKV